MRRAAKLEQTATPETDAPWHATTALEERLSAGANARLDGTRMNALPWENTPVAPSARLDKVRIGHLRSSSVFPDCTGMKADFFVLIGSC